MSSFGSMIYIRVGYYKAIRSFVLNERRHLGDRLASITSELNRIGEVTITYEANKNDDGGNVVTEKRMGISVSAGTSMEKLFQSYVALGGNPLDISMFFRPNLSTEVNPNVPDVEPVTKHIYPYGGVAAPESFEYHATADYGGDDVASMKEQESGESLTFGEFPGGYVNLISYVPRRVGGREPATPSDEHTMTCLNIHALRGWVGQEIKEKLHMLEEKIIKLADLREQLETERDRILVQSWGSIAGSWNATMHLEAMRVPNLLVDFDADYFIWDKQADAPLLWIKNLTKINAIHWAYDDDKTEDLLDLMFG